MAVLTEIDSLNSFITQWFPLLSAFLGISVGLVASAYSIGVFVNDEKLKSWAKSELFEVFYSAIIVVIIMMLILPTARDQSMINTFTKSIMGIQNVQDTTALIAVKGDKSFCTNTAKDGKLYEQVDLCGSNQVLTDPSSVYSKTEACHIRLGTYFLREIFDETRDYAYTIYLSYIRTSMAAEFGINMESPLYFGGMISINPLKGFFTMGNKIKEMVFDWAIKLMTLLKFQEVILLFIATSVFPAFLIMGAILRAFPLTRRLGGLLLGMSLSLYFAFPTFYAFGGLMLIKLKSDPAIQQAWKDTNNLDTRAKGELQWIPIANTMYLNGTMPTLGGSSTISAKEYRDQLARLNCYKDEDVEDLMNSKKITDSNNKDDALNFNFDFGNDRQLSDAEAKAESQTLTSKVTEWLKQFTKLSVLDPFAQTAWKPNGPLDSMARLTFWGMFFSLLSIIATIGSIRSLSATFGGDIEISGLTRLI